MKFKFWKCKNVAPNANYSDGEVMPFITPNEFRSMFWSKEMVHVALRLPFSDGSGHIEILGVYKLKYRAEARCYRECEKAGYYVETEIVEMILDEDNDLKENDASKEV